MASNLIARSILFPPNPLIFSGFFVGCKSNGMDKWGFFGVFGGYFWCKMV
jgi:hypothetical protein